MENINYNIENINYNMENINYNMENINYNMENIKINYGTSYVSNPLIGTSFNFISNELSHEHIFLNTNNGIIEVKNTFYNPYAQSLSSDE